jgi:hypothetical protein
MKAITYEVRVADGATTCWPETTLTTAGRLALGAVAVGGTIAYAWSFTRVASAGPLLPLATAVGIAAGVSWLVFGAVLLIVTGARPSIAGWVDACLHTMAVGMAVLSAATLANVAWPALPLAWLLAVHGCALLASNIVMAARFVARARALGLPPVAAVTFWMVGLNATFAAILFALGRVGVR